MMSNEFKIDQQELDRRKAEAVTDYIVRNSTEVKRYFTFLEALNAYAELLDQGYTLTNIPGITPTHQNGAYTIPVKKPDSILADGITAAEAQAEQTYQAELDAAKAAHIEAQVAAAVAAHEAEQARKAQQATDKIAEKARAAAIAALGESN
jgi:hypothetical protein